MPTYIDTYIITIVTASRHILAQTHLSAMMCLSLIFIWLGADWGWECVVLIAPDRGQRLAQTLFLLVDDTREPFVKVITAKPGFGS
jgi:hypothetical protein